jgi:glutathione S-transferase
VDVARCVAKASRHVAIASLPALSLLAQGPAAADRKGREVRAEARFPWERADEFMDMNPAGQTPVMEEDARGFVLIDSRAICEYFERRWTRRR